MQGFSLGHGRTQRRLRVFVDIYENLLYNTIMVKEQTFNRRFKMMCTLFETKTFKILGEDSADGNYTFLKVLEKKTNSVKLEMTVKHLTVERIKDALSNKGWTGASYYDINSDFDTNQRLVSINKLPRRKYSISLLTNEKVNGNWIRDEIVLVED